MNREITTKKVGRQKKLTNPCPVIKGETEVMVGSPRCITCQGFERKLEERIRNYYLPVKNTFEAVLYRRLNIPDSPRGLCVDLIDVSRTISREFALVEEVFLWRHVIKPWFTPQRFNIEIVYFGYYNPTIIKLQGEGLRIEGRIWYRVPLENLKDHEYLLETAFWFPISKEHNDNRIKILECALEDLERIKREGEPELPPLTFEEPKIYP